MDTRCCSKNAAARKKRFHSFEIFRCIGQVNLLIRRISLIKEQGSHIFEELCQDLGDIFSIVHELIEEIQGSRQIAAANFLYQARIVSRPAIPRTCRTVSAVTGLAMILH